MTPLHRGFHEPDLVSSLPPKTVFVPTSVPLLKLCLLFVTFLFFSISLTLFQSHLLWEAFLDIDLSP